jgi:hypothetical protein
MNTDENGTRVDPPKSIDLSVSVCPSVFICGDNIFSASSVSAVNNVFELG